MRFLDQPAPVVVIVGPTAVGKTEISIQLAERLNGEIVSADSRLFYRGMDIGTAKPSPKERQRVPHHLIDVAEPDEIWSLALFQRAARTTIAEIQARKGLPFLVGGTGQYIRAVAEGWDLPTQQPDDRLRKVLENWSGVVGVQGLYARLAVIDPSAAQIIEPNNVRRTIRALEVIFRTGKRFSEQRLRQPSPYNLLMIGLRRPRAELYDRIDARIEAMLAGGLIEEVRGLMARDYPLDLPTLSAIGYREIGEYIQGKLTFGEAVDKMKRLTRQFVRRQANWFKDSDPSIHWFDVHDGMIDQIEALIRS